jgi:hypothetical protein
VVVVSGLGAHCRSLMRAHRHQADPDHISAQTDLISVPQLIIGEEPSGAPNGGSSARPTQTASQRVTPDVLPHSASTA